LPAGTQLIETRVAAVFGVSRERVRKALHRLGHERLLELVPNKGAFVKAPDLMQAREIYEARRVVEGGIVARLAHRLSRQQLAALRAHLASEQVAADEGDRVGRVTVLQTKPVGCRFYFQYDASQLIGEITVSVFATPTEAYNAMVLSARGHPEVQSYPDVGDGAVAYQTPLRGSPAWQCVFAQGRSVVTVRTQQPYPALNAVNLAREIVPKFK